MHLWHEKYLIKAPVAHVYQCFIDFDYFEKLLRGHKTGHNVEFKYDRDKPFIAPNELVMIEKEPLCKLVPGQHIRNEYLQIDYIPLANSLKKLGPARIECRLEEKHNKTIAHVDLFSKKTPGILMRIFIRIIVFVLMLQARSDKKKFISYIEESV